MTNSTKHGFISMTSSLVEGATHPQTISSSILVDGGREDTSAGYTLANVMRGPIVEPSRHRLSSRLVCITFVDGSERRKICTIRASGSRQNRVVGLVGVVLAQVLILYSKKGAHQYSIFSKIQLVTLLRIRE